MANVVLGKIAITWKGVYDSNTVYYSQDVVNHGANAYICTAANTTGAFVTTDWDLFAQGTSDVANTAGDMIYNDGSNLVRLPIGTNGQVLGISSVTGFPEWQSIPSRSSRHVAYLIEHKGMSTNNQPIMVVLSDGSLCTWGYNGVYSMGVGNVATNHAIPQLTSFPKGFPGVNTNKFWLHHDWACFAIDSTGDLWSWGRAGNGANGAGADAYIPVNLMTLNNASNDFYNYGAKAVDIAHGGGDEDELCQLILGDDNKVYSAGYNGYGQLGDGTTTQRAYFYRIQYFVDNNINISKIAMGRQQYTCCGAISTNGDLYMWGYNGHGQLGDGTTTNRSLPILINTGSLNGKTKTDIWCSGYQTFVRDSDGDLHHFGGDYYGSSGLGINTSGTVNVRSTPEITWDASVMGAIDDFAFHSYSYPGTYIISNNKVYFTGYSAYGSSGFAANASLSQWTEIVFPDFEVGEVPVKIVVNGTGSYNSCAVLTNQGRVHTWGYNGYGQLGKGVANGSVHAPPVAINFNGTITDVAWYGHAQYGKLVVLNDDGRVFACGYGDNNDLAHEDGEEYYTLQPIRI